MFGPSIYMLDCGLPDGNLDDAVTQFSISMLYLVVRAQLLRIHPEGSEEFTTFFRDIEPRLSYALAAAFGVEVGKESTADALTYAWENWERVRGMENPGGYLYRVGRTAARRYRRRGPLFPQVATSELPEVEPGLPDALSSLSESQRSAVVLLYVLEWTEREAADLLGIDRSTVRRHRDRGLTKLRSALEVKPSA